MGFPRTILETPGWVLKVLPDAEHVYATAADRMRLAIALSRLNVEKGTGGPFGAAVFDMNTHRLMAPGVNVVVPARCSVAHAEIMALMTAQQVLGSHDLGGAGRPACELVTSTEPCAMCLGAIPWSGVRALVCGARGEDAGGIGLDEGAKPEDWAGALKRRGIRVHRDVCREEAVAVLQDYARSGGPIYNGRSA